MNAFADLPGVEHAVEESYSPPVDGWHKVSVYEISDKVDTKKGDGKQYVFTLKIQDGDDSGKTIKYRTLVESDTAKKLGFGLALLNKLCKALGYKDYKDVETMGQMMHRPFDVKLESKPQKDNKDYFNTNIKEWGFESGEDNKTAGAPASGGAAGDWRNKK